jgi:hypothetical protein
VEAVEGKEGGVAQEVAAVVEADVKSKYFIYYGNKAKKKLK